jgi:hypothetical protein
MKSKKISPIMKKIAILFAFITFWAHSQKENIPSTARLFIDKAQKTRINKDWTLIANFKSGIGETVDFYPVQIVDLKTNEKTNALQLDMLIKIVGGFGGSVVNTSAWVGLDEVDEFINFIEDNIIPNLDVKYKKKSSEFIFKAKEITLSYIIDEKRRRLTISLNNYKEKGGLSNDFWTEAKVDNFPDLVDILKKVKSKELKF